MTFRTLLAMTTALSISIPAMAFAQSDAREAVQGVLETYGYDVSEMDRLTNSQIAEIYLISTSEDGGDVRMLLSGMDIGHNAEMMPAGFERTSMIDTRVREVLDSNQYDTSVIEFMSDAEVAQIYLAASTEENPDLSGKLAAMNLPGSNELSGSLGTTFDVGSSMQRAVSERMMTMGYTQAQIDTLDGEEVAEVYLALTSEDMNEVRNAIEGALAS